MAIVCDDLIQKGGNEKVVMKLCEMYPDAHLYTTMVTKEWEQKCKDKKINLKTTYMQKLPFKKILSRVYAPFSLYIFALESIDFTEYDLVLSVSSRFAHGIITKPATKHISYINTVGRMFWEPDIYFKHENFGGLKTLATLFLTPFLSIIRVWDRTACTRPDYIISNSRTTHDRIKKYYGRESKIIYPFFDSSKLNVSEKDTTQDDKEYYVVLTRLVGWKRADYAIEAFKENGKSLIIVGEGPQKSTLEALAAGCENIKFTGYVSLEEKIRLLSNCTALINTQLEDFGIVPLEAMYLGRPVIAYGKGGVLETIQGGVTGEFFKVQTSQSLNELLNNFDSKKYGVDDCRNQALKFSEEVFEKEIRSFVNSV